MRLKDKVAVVTGAASGIGKEIARKFADEGAKVVIADLNQQGADAAAKELDASGQRAVGVAMDVTSEPQVEAGMAKAIAAFGRLDILVSILDEFEFAKWKHLLGHSGRRLPDDAREQAFRWLRCLDAALNCNLGEAG